MQLGICRHLLSACIDHPWMPASATCTSTFPNFSKQLHTTHFLAPVVSLQLLQQWYRMRTACWSFWAECWAKRCTRASLWSCALQV